MTRRVTLPTDEQVRTALRQLLDESANTGTRATVVELARRVGLTNPTFWRHFPAMASELRTSAPAATSADTPADTSRALQNDHARLRRTNAALSEDLTAALACIQRLTLENRSLRTQLEESAKVVGLPRKTHAPDLDRETAVHTPCS